MGEQITGRDVCCGDIIQDPRGSRFLRIDAIVEVPEMHGRTLWFEDCGRGDYRAVRLDEPLTRTAGTDEQ
jgi:hypothetical protein